MFVGGALGGKSRNTSSALVLPFYLYGTFSFLIASFLLLSSSAAFTQHYFNPKILAITHIMALGWGTMVILGASHQLVPVLIEGKIYSEPLGFVTFGFAAVGIPMLVIAFYQSRFDWLAQWGGIFICTAVLLFLYNLYKSIAQAKNENVHALFIFTATAWLLATVVLGVLLIFNFTSNFLPENSLHYLPLHAHMGIAGWFLLLVIGVGSRLIPMFMISKYENKTLLWWTFALINAGMLLFVFFFFYNVSTSLHLIPTLILLAGLALFAIYCRHAWKQRLRKKIDGQVKISLLSVGMIFIPVLLLIAIIVLLSFVVVNSKLLLLYGFCIFFGWLTAIILGMSFKTLPFILWNKKFTRIAGKGKTPSPKDLFSDQIFNWTAGFYLIGFITFSVGILLETQLIIFVAACLLFVCSILYNINILKMFMVKPQHS